MMYSLPYIGFNIFINTILLGVADTISTLSATGPILLKFKRKRALFIIGLLLSIFLLAFYCFPD